MITRKSRSESSATEELTSGHWKNIHRFSHTRLLSRVFNQSHRLSVIFWLAFLFFPFGLGLLLVCNMVVCGWRLPSWIYHPWLFCLWPIELCLWTSYIRNCSSGGSLNLLVIKQQLRLFIANQKRLIRRFFQHSHPFTFSVYNKVKFPHISSYCAWLWQKKLNQVLHYINSSTCTSRRELFTKNGCHVDTSYLYFSS